MPNDMPLSDWMGFLVSEYLSTFIKDGGAAIKFAVTQEDLKPELRTAIVARSKDLGYSVIEVDAAVSRVHMPQDIFFGMASQVNWRILARRLILRLASDRGYQVDGIDPDDSGNIFKAIGELKMFPESSGEKAVRIDKKKVSAIRPSRLVSILLENQRKRPRFRGDAFLEALYKAYRILSEGQISGRLIDDRQVRSVVPLAKVYEVFTSLPGSNRDYDQTDFARDLYFLDEGEIRQTKSGARVTFPASTGTRSARGTFSFVGPDGHVITYYGIQFSGGA